jgi:hypothetical protein
MEMPVSSSGTAAQGPCRATAQKVRRGAVIAFAAGRAQRLLQDAVGLIESAGTDQARLPYIDARSSTCRCPALRLKFHGSATEPEAKASPHQEVRVHFLDQRFELRPLPMLCTRLSFPEIAAEMFLSRLTIKV